MIAALGARFLPILAGTLLSLAALTVSAPAAGTRELTKDEKEAFVLFLNIKEDIVARCIYRPSERKVVADALKLLAQDLGPAYASYFPTSLSQSFSEASKVYQKTLIELAKAPGLERRTIQQLVEQSMRVFCYSLDRYSDYDDLETLAREKTVKKEDYIGVGMTIERTPEGYDCFPFPGEPADLAGVLAGDRLMAVDGNSVRGVTKLNVALMILGKDNTSVSLKLRHLGDEKDSIVTIKRGQIRTSLIEVSQAADGATVRLRRINDSAVRDLRTFLRTVPPKQKLTLDFRGCPGGDFNAALAIAELFLPADSIICTLETRNGKEVFKSKNATPFKASSMVILQDKATMSGAELITVALVTSPVVKAESRGERTYGKGVTVGEFEVEGGGRLRIADARMYGPHGEFWDGEGLAPTTEDLRPK